MKRIFLWGCLLPAAYGANAQTDSTHNKDSFYLLSPIEVRALRLSTKAPFAVSNIGKNEIQKQNLGQNLPYLLNQVPSLVTSSDDGLGVGYSSMRLRGTDITRINVTINGIPVNDPESQGVFFVNTPDLASSTSSIQIQRGVGSSTNGAGAFGGSLNLSNNEQSREATAYASNAYGSYNTWKHTIGASTGILKGGFQFDIRASKLSSNGYIQRASSDLKSLHFIGGWTSLNEMTNIKFNFITGKQTTGQAWNGIGTYFTDKDEPATVNYSKQLDAIGRRTNTLGEMYKDKNGNPVYYNDQTDNYQQDYYQLFLNHKFNSRWSSNIGLFMTRGRGYYNEYKKGEYFSSYFLPGNVTIGDSIIEKTNLTRQLWLDNYYYGGVLSATYNYKNTNLVLGGGYAQYDAKHYGFIKWAEIGIPVDYRWYNLTAYKTDFNIYGKLQQQIIDNLYGFADLQYRYVSHEMNGFRKNPEIESSGLFHFFNPKLGLSYFINHLQSRLSKVYASFAVANKEPNRDDFETSDNASVGSPERLYDFEVGYGFESPLLQAGINGYYMNYKNQLINTGKINDVGASVRANVPKSYRAGIELTAISKPLDWLQISANATFSKNKIKEITEYHTIYNNDEDWEEMGQGTQTFRNTDISFSPNTIAAGSVTVEPFYGKIGKHKLFLDLSEKYVGRQYLDNSSNKLKSINPYALTNVSIRYFVPSNTFKELGIIFTVNNIFNKKYENNGYTYSYYFNNSATLATENYYFPQAGINWNIGLNIRF
ncbi:MAG: TonB-dependent receptor [Niabella sp.]